MRRTRAPANVTPRGASPPQGLRRPVPRRGHRRCAAGPRSRRHAAAARRLAAGRAARPVTTTPSATVSIVGSGVVAERLRRIVADRHRLVGADPAATRRARHRRAGQRRPARRAGRRAAGRRHPRRVDERRPSTTCASLLDLDDLARADGATLVVGAAVSPGLSGLLARHLARQLIVLRRAAHRRARDGGTVVRPRAPRGPAAAGPSAGTTTTGSSGRPAAAASSAGSPSPSAPATATAARCPTRGCCTAASPRSTASAPGCRRPDGTASRPGCRCSARPIARAASAPCASRLAAHDEPGGAGDADHGHRRADRHRRGGRGRGVRRPPGRRRRRCPASSRRRDADLPDRGPPAADRRPRRRPPPVLHRHRLRRRPDPTPSECFAAIRVSACGASPQQTLGVHKHSDGYPPGRGRVRVPWMPGGADGAGRRAGRVLRPPPPSRRPDGAGRRCCCTAGRRRATCSSSPPTRRWPTRFTFVGIDHRGHGRGLRSPDPFTLEDAADDVAAVIRQLGARPGGRRRVLDGRPGGDCTSPAATPSSSPAWSSQATALEWSGTRRERLLWRVLPIVGSWLRSRGYRRYLNRAVAKADRRRPRPRAVRAVAGQRDVAQRRLRDGRRRAGPVPLRRPAVGVVAAACLPAAWSRRGTASCAPSKQRALATELGAVVRELPADHLAALVGPGAVRRADRRADRRSSSRPVSRRRRRAPRRRPT